MSGATRAPNPVTKRLWFAAGCLWYRPSMSCHAHASPPATPTEERRLVWAMAITLCLMLAEAVGGLWSGSLALLADAGHMLFDLLALVLAVVAARIARRPADARRTYGYGRVEVVGALINGVTLLLMAGLIVYEAFGRVMHPEPIAAGAMFGLATLGLLANLVALALLHGGQKTSVGVRAAVLHVTGDALSSVGVMGGALAINLTGEMRIDPYLSALIAIVIGVSSVRLLSEVVQILLQSAPSALSYIAAEKLILETPGVLAVRHLHLWQMTQAQPVCTAHVEVDATKQDASTIRIIIEKKLAERLPAALVTLQMDSCPQK